MATSKNVRITRNQYGNYRGHLTGQSHAELIGSREYDALEWLSARLEEGASLLASSYFVQADVDKHNADKLAFRCVSSKSTPAAETYAHNARRVAQQIAELQQKLEAHKARMLKDADNWGYAGDLMALTSRLDEVLAHV